MTGRFEPLRPLGRGGMGEVWLARDRESGAEVALKRLQPDALGPVDVARFVREAELLARVAHPGIVRLFGWGVDGGGPWLAMEVLPGGSLAELLRRTGPLPEARVARVGVEVGLALSYAHAAGVLHRDLKPENVLFDAAGSARLVDFGLARPLVAGGSLTATGVLLGTPGYMAPELLLEGSYQATPASDVYGLGATLYQLLSGRPPFLEASPLLTLEAVLRTDPLPPSRLRPGVEPTLERIVLACLSRDPLRRPELVVVTRALGRLASGAPPRRGKTRRWPLAAAALIALMAAVAAGLALGLAGESPPPAVVPPVAAEVPSSTVAPSATSRWAEAARAGDVRGAVDVLDRALLEDPNDLTLLETRMSYLQVLDPERSYADAERILALAPRHVLARVARGWARLYRGEIEPARRDGLEALTIDPGSIDACLFLATLAHQVQDFPGAVARCTRALELDHGARYPEARPLRGLAHLFGADLASAARDADEPLAPGARVGSQYWRLQTVLLQALLRLEEAEAAHATWSAQPGLSKAQRNEMNGLRETLRARRERRAGPIPELLTRAHARLDDDPGRAFKLLREAIQADPASWEAVLLMAELNARGGERERVRIFLRWARGLAPREVEARVAVAGNCARLGEPAEGLLALEGIEHREARLLRATLFQMTGAPERGLAEVNAVLQLEPDDLAALVRRAQVLVGQERLEEARADLDRACQLAPDRLDTRVTRGMLRVELGDAAGALVDLDRALELDPTVAAVHEERGFALVLAGALDRAREELEWLRPRAFEPIRARRLKELERTIQEAERRGR